MAAIRLLLICAVCCCAAVTMADTVPRDDMTIVTAYPAYLSDPGQASDHAATATGAVWSLGVSVAAQAATSEIPGQLAMPPTPAAGRSTVALAGLSALIAGLLIGWFIRGRRAGRAGNGTCPQAAGENDRMQAIFAAVSEGILGLDSKRNIRMINPPARRMLGLSETAQLPLAWPGSVRFLDPEMQTPVEAERDPLLLAAQGGGLSGEIFQLNAGATEQPARFVTVSSAAVGGQGDGLVSVMVLSDVTVQERARQQSERHGRLDALGQMTGGVAHEFNNILATILFAVDLSLQGKLPDTSRRVLASAMSAIDRGRDLTGRLLAFAKRRPGQRFAVPVAEVFNDLGAMARPMLENETELVFAGAESGLAVYCDPAGLENALLNLILNSRDALIGSEGAARITVTIRAAGTDAPGTKAGQDTSVEFVEIEVHDNGPGMEEAVRARAVDPFFTTKNLQSGSGLGLSIVYGFAQQSGGDMQIVSAPGEGTSVFIYVPRGVATEVRESDCMSPARRRKGNGQTVLLVEDEDALRDMTASQLSGLGYDVVMAASGQDALKLIEEGLSFDLLLSDIVMPGGLNGFALAEKVRSRTPDRPVVLISGDTGSSDAREESGDLIVLQKPCATEILAETLWYALNSDPGAVAPGQRCSA